jgi:hypothetical protein
VLPGCRVAAFLKGVIVAEGPFACPSRVNALPAGGASWMAIFHTITDAPLTITMSSSQAIETLCVKRVFTGQITSM